jgi:hypothetical protein
MINQKQIQELADEAKAYVEAKVELVKMQFIEEGSENFARLMTFFIIGGVCLIFLIMLSFFVGMTLSVLWENYIAGFGVVAAFYFILLLVFIVFRKSALQKPLQNEAIKSIFKHEQED